MLIVTCRRQRNSYIEKALLQDSSARANPAKPRIKMTKQVRAASAALITLLAPLHDNDRLKVKHEINRATFRLGVLRVDVQLEGHCLNLKRFDSDNKII